MKRKIYEKLVAWKSRSNGSTAILIEGARRIGKTYIIEEFAKNEYKSYIIVDFSKASSEIMDTFENSINDFDAFFNRLEILYNTKLYRRESIIVFDEVQLYPKARQLIKHLVADGRYDFAETGSLISLYRNVKDILIPSEEEKIKMYPMDFEEYLWAMNEELTYDYIKDCYNNLKPLGQALHKKALNLFREYILVGGMPKAVLAYSNGKDFEKVEFEKKQVYNLYVEDINKFANGEKTKAKKIFEYIPTQLQKKSKKIVYADMKNDSRSSDYENAFIFLNESMMVHICNNVTDPAFPLALSSNDNEKKCYMLDTGILITECLKGEKYINSEIYKSILFDKLFINEGMFMENVVACSLINKDEKLYYYKHNDNINSENDIEIDLLIQRNGKVCPIEVKSSVYKRHTSLDKFVTKYKKKIGRPYILYQKDILVRDGIYHLPIYMAGMI